MIDRVHPLPVTRQSELLHISRGSVYYLPKPIRDADLKLMRRIDELHLEWPFAGARMLRDLFCQEGVHIGRKHVATLMRKMGIEALYRRPNTSRKHPGHPIYPYLLRHLAVTRPNQIEAVEEAIQHHGTPGIFNTDQGSQFTSEAFTGLLKNHHIRISMDGKGAWRDNVFVERLWKSVKYEEVYLKAYNTVSEARTSIGKYFEFYNRRRPHSSLDRMTPEQFYFKSLPVTQAA